MSFKDIKVALDLKLSELTGDYPIVFDNANYHPTLNNGYIRPTIIPGNSAMVDIKGSQEEIGIYQIDMVFPVNAGLVNVLAKSDELFALFKNQELQYNDTIVYVREVSRLPFFKEDAWVVGAIQINYVSYVQY